MCTTSGQTHSGTHVAQQRQCTLTLSEKFQRCKRLGQQLIALACEGGTEQFHSHFTAMQRLVSVWEKGETAVITSGQDSCETVHYTTGMRYHNCFLLNKSSQSNLGREPRSYAATNSHWLQWGTPYFTQNEGRQTKDDR